MTGILAGAGRVASAAGLLAAATPRLHLLTGLAGVVCMLGILRLVRRRQLRAKYALLWLAVGVAFMVLGLSPGLLDWAARKAGVAYAPDLLFLVGTMFLVLVVMHLSWELSRLEDRTKLLAEEVALLRAEVAEGPQGRPERAGLAVPRPGLAGESTAAPAGPGAGGSPGAERRSA